MVFEVNSTDWTLIFWFEKPFSDALCVEGVFAEKLSDFYCAFLFILRV
jgi:hypothetical protein